MPKCIKRTAHRDNGGRLGENYDGGRGHSFSYPQYKGFSRIVQSLARVLRRAMMRAALALTGAGERVATWGQWLGERLGLALIIAGDRLAAAALAWECGA